MHQGDVPGKTIKIIGVGEAGVHMLTRLQIGYDPFVHKAAVSTDAQALPQDCVDETCLIGSTVTHGLGTGGEIDLGRQAAEADRKQLLALVDEAEVIFLVAGLGGGTGSGAGPAIARWAIEKGAWVLAFVCLPFAFEGERRQRQAQEGLVAFRSSCNAVIPLSNDILMQAENQHAVDGFAQTDQWIRRGIVSLCTLLFEKGVIHFDLAVLRKALGQRGGKALFALGHAQGDDYIAKALKDLMVCPLLQLPEGTRYPDHLLVSLLGGADLSMGAIQRIMETLKKQFGPEVQTVLGAVIDTTRRESVEICLLGTANIQRPAAEPEVEQRSSHQRSAIRLADQTQLSPVKSGQKDWQEEFPFFKEREQRGYFGKTECNLFAGEDLDVPTYLRKGIKIVL